MKISNKEGMQVPTEVKRTENQVFYSDGSIGPTEQAQQFMDSCGASPPGEEALRSVGMWNLIRNDTEIEGEIPEFMKLTFLRSINTEHVLDLQTKGRTYKRLWVKLRNPQNGKHKTGQQTLRAR